ncbi:MAG: hypothetical protein KDA24_28265 [Deltaproteobacteria bacterium]|nr:hypothetical protein [Deltaproteobacteria bacterium]
MRVELFALTGCLLLLSGCPVADIADPSTLPCGADEAVVEIATTDGVTLTADYRPAASEERGAVVLFHMIPPGNDRSGFPVEVRDAIAARDLTVLNVDRRGAGGSDGIAEEAYEGDGGRLDMEAAVRFLASAQLPCRVDTRSIALLGASNGTTSVLDYTVGRDATLPQPATLIWMSPGGYTESQNRIPDHRGLLDVIPVLWMYPDSEDYALSYIDDAAPSWRFVELGSAHGTRMFDGGELQTQATTEITEYLARWIAP